jgi:transcriptional repressor NrdR
LPACWWLATNGPFRWEALREAAASIERDLFQEFEDEVPSTEIGERVVEKLRQMDTVAFVRFASVYREFETVSDFREIVESCRDEPVSAIR